jgi:hypothetical protein
MHAHIDHYTGAIGRKDIARASYFANGTVKTELDHGEISAALRKDDYFRPSPSQRLSQSALRCSGSVAMLVVRWLITSRAVSSVPAIALPNSCECDWVGRGPIHNPAKANPPVQQRVESGNSITSLPENRARLINFTAASDRYTAMAPRSAIDWGTIQARRF